MKISIVDRLLEFESQKTAISLPLVSTLLARLGVPVLKHREPGWVLQKRILPLLQTDFRFRAVAGINGKIIAQRQKLGFDAAD